MADHGNTGFKVKNLRGTSGCKHYRGLEAAIASKTKCATNSCPKMANRACHLISGNQNAETGKRFIAYLCPSCNGKYDRVLTIRANAKAYELPDCKCGTWP